MYILTHPQDNLKYINKYYSNISSINSIMSKILKLSSLNDFKSIDTAKIIIIKIGAEWCIPCKTIYPLYSQFAEYNKNDNIIYTTVDVDDADAELLDFIEVKSLPTFNIYKNGVLDNSIISSDKYTISTCFNNL